VVSQHLIEYQSVCVCVCAGCVHSSLLAAVRARAVQILMASVVDQPQPHFLYIGVVLLADACIAGITAKNVPEDRWVSDESKQEHDTNGTDSVLDEQGSIHWGLATGAEIEVLMSRTDQEFGSLMCTELKQMRYTLLLAGSCLHRRTARPASG
jgi:hypothetical protein